MKFTNPVLSSLSRAERIGLVTLLAAVLLAFWDMRLSAVLLGAFILLCMFAPFFPGSSFYLPVISRGVSGKNAVALTFDDGPDPSTTPELLRLLAEHDVKATFFVTGKRALKYPDLVREILRRGHALGNHTYSHDPLIALRSRRRLSEEIISTQDLLHEFGIRCLAFRPPMGTTNPRLRKVLRRVDLICIGFSRRAFDGGNKWTSGLSTRILKRIRPDDIVLLHDIRPKEGRLLPWLKEVETILSGLEARGIAVLPLSEIVERPIMVTEIQTSFSASKTVSDESA